MSFKLLEGTRELVAEFVLSTEEFSDKNATVETIVEDIETHGVKTHELLKALSIHTSNNVLKGGFYPALMELYKDYDPDAKETPVKEDKPAVEAPAEAVSSTPDKSIWPEPIDSVWKRASMMKAFHVTVSKMAYSLDHLLNIVDQGEDESTFGRKMTENAIRSGWAYFAGDPTIIRRGWQLKAIATTGGDEEKYQIVSITKDEAEAFLASKK